MTYARCALAVLMVTAPLAALPGAASAQGVRATPKPTFSVRPDSMPPRGATVAYARRLAFDTLSMARDSRIVSSLANGRLVNGQVMVDPELGAYRLDSAALDSGRVIARLTVRGTAWGLPQGMTYVWVDRNNGHWRAVYVPESPAAPAWQQALHIRPVSVHTMNTTMRTQAMSSATVKTGSLSADGTISRDTTKVCLSCLPMGWCEAPLLSAAMMAAINPR